MTVTVLPVDRSDIALFWPEVFSPIERGIVEGRHRFTSQGIRRDLEAGSKLLWVAQRDGAVIAAIVTTINPTTSVLTILLNGGDDMDAWLDQALERIEHYAAVNGCIVDLVGRAGWRKKLASRGYVHAGEWLVKELVA